MARHRPEVMGIFLYFLCRRGEKVWIHDWLVIMRPKTMIAGREFRKGARGPFPAFFFAWILKLLKYIYLWTAIKDFPEVNQAYCHFWALNWETCSQFFRWFSHFYIVGCLAVISEGTMLLLLLSGYQIPVSCCSFLKAVFGTCNNSRSSGFSVFSII